MGRYLLLDIGAGTLDMLCYDTDHDLHYKAVVRSPVRVLADEIRQTRGNLVVTGCEMGGGPVSQALIDRAKTADVRMSAPAAATIHHDMQRVAAHGIRVVDAAEAEALKSDSRFHHIRTGDLQPDRLQRLVQGFGVPFEFDAVAVCAQDHGVAPPGVSHLDFRHRMFTAALADNPVPETLLYRSDQVPAEMNRLSAIANDARALPTDRVYVMDSGMAAILGASMDVLAADRRRILVLDIATSHTVGAAVEAWRAVRLFRVSHHGHHCCAAGPVAHGPGRRQALPSSDFRSRRTRCLQPPSLRLRRRRADPGHRPPAATGPGIKAAHHLRRSLGRQHDDRNGGPDGGREAAGRAAADQLPVTDVSKGQAVSVK